MQNSCQLISEAQQAWRLPCQEILDVWYSGATKATASTDSPADSTTSISYQYLCYICCCFSHLTVIVHDYCKWRTCQNRARRHHNSRDIKLFLDIFCRSNVPLASLVGLAPLCYLTWVCSNHDHIRWLHDA